jgi:hypothetical protein
MLQISTSRAIANRVQRQRLCQYEVEKYPTGAIAIVILEKREASSVRVVEKFTSSSCKMLHHEFSFYFPHKHVDIQMPASNRLVAKKLLQFCVRLLFVYQRTL